ncbi:hypothetical protein CCAX7_55060 [Capsulimonas corticalis]|uniref:Uncharacterized protein n=1 Tax=Capsulimonas corticalis TaxID=2219043 RepID=A0A402D5M2_9BACT|nr:hypothetical protein [Capsulimonas corticalis]BDI33455.1 hypothetical protein CCAX7_55060 [Capsulimonas corticalis]
MTRKPWPCEEIVNWTERYLRTRDSDLVLWPWIDFEKQPACTIGRQPGAKGAVVPGTVTPEDWTRQLLRHWARTVDAYTRGDFDPATFEGKVIALNALPAERLLFAYRRVVEDKRRSAPAAAQERELVYG